VQSLGMDQRLGPESAESLGCWDQTFARIFVQSGLARNLLHNLRFGGLATTDFSGYDSPRESWRVLLPAIASQVGIACPSVHFVRSSDWGKQQSQALCELSTLTDHGSSCVFGDIKDRLTVQSKLWVESASPTKAMSQSSAQEANSSILHFLRTFKDSNYKVSSTAPCLQHCVECPVHALHALRQQRKAATAEASSSSQFRRRYKNTGAPWWTLPLPGCDAGEPLSFGISGLVCTDYCALGQQRRGCGLTEPNHHVWEVERTFTAEADLEDLYFSENSDRYPVEEKQKQPLQETHHVVSVRISPRDLGFPMRRRRLFTAGLCKRKWIWTGPSTCEQVETEFFKLFGSTCELTGDVYYAAASEEIEQMVVQMSTKRRKTLPEGWRDMQMSEYMHLISSPSGMVRKGQYENLLHVKQSLGGSFLADLDHNIGFGPTAGPDMPSLDTHPTIFSWLRGRLATPMELLAAQGVDMYPELSGGRLVSPLRTIFKKYSSNQVRFMAGNSMHIPTHAVWMLYVISHMVKRSDHSGLEAQLGPPNVDSELDVDDACLAV
jgi:hypothetical protein